jgi:hypothetical protein
LLLHWPTRRTVPPGRSTCAATCRLRRWRQARCPTRSAGA